MTSNGCGELQTGCHSWLLFCRIIPRNTISRSAEGWKARYCNSLINSSNRKSRYVTPASQLQPYHCEIRSVFVGWRLLIHTPSPCWNIQWMQKFYTFSDVPHTHTRARTHADKRSQAHARTHTHKHIDTRNARRFASVEFYASHCRRRFSISFQILIRLHRRHLFRG